MCRYARLEQVEMIGRAGLAALQSARAAIVGVGNIGGQVAPHLAMIGVGLVLVDRDVVSEENLGTQGFADADLGLPKVEARVRALARLNPTCRIEPIFADARRLGLGALRDVDIIFSCLDSRGARIIVNELAGRLGIPWVDGAVDGSGRTSFGHVAAYGSTPEAPCYLCPHDHHSLRIMLEEEKSEGCPAWRWGAEGPPTFPTLATSATGAAVAAAQVIWGLKLLLGRRKEVVGRKLCVDLDFGHLSTHGLERNPACVFDHRAFPLTPVGRPVGGVTVGETFEMAEQQVGEGATLQLHRASVVTDMRCPACAHVCCPYRVLEAMTAAEARCDCGALMQPTAPGILDRFTEAEAPPFLDRTWGELGLPEEDVVTATASKPGRAVHLLFSSRPPGGAK
jgi:adenylyltransferase/sulfurtransferase